MTVTLKEEISVKQDSILNGDKLGLDVLCLSLSDVKWLVIVDTVILNRKQMFLVFEGTSNNDNILRTTDQIKSLNYIVE